MQWLSNCLKMQSMINWGHVIFIYFKRIFNLFCKIDKETKHSEIFRMLWIYLEIHLFLFKEFYTTESKLPSGQPNSSGPHLGKSNRHVSSYISIYYHLSIARKLGYYLIKYVKRTFSKSQFSLSSLTETTKKRFK